MNNWKKLYNECVSCTECELKSQRKQVVFGIGNPAAEVIFVGEAPGANEDELGMPFVGRSGKLLDKYLASINLYRNENIFITNIVKCRPPANRDPLPKEREACLPWLEQQIFHMQPKIVICVGRIAGHVLIKPDLAITKEHGLWVEKTGIFFTATLHPAAILRNPKQNELAVQDFASIEAKIKEICTKTY